MQNESILVKSEQTNDRELALSLFKDYLRKEKSHLTYERRILFEEIYNLKGAFCVEEVIEKCSPDGQYISRGTIYKTVKLMEEAGIIGRIPKQGKKQYFEFVHTGWNKGYLICMHCGRMATIDIDKMQEFEETLAGIKDFTPKSMTVTINGICSRCR